MREHVRIKQLGFAWHVQCWRAERPHRDPVLFDEHHHQQVRLPGWFVVDEHVRRHVHQRLLPCGTSRLLGLPAWLPFDCVLPGQRWLVPSHAH